MSLYLTYTKITDWWSGQNFTFCLLNSLQNLKEQVLLTFFLIFFILFICACFLLLFLYNSVIPSFTEPVFVSNQTISYKETHHFYQNKILKIKKINLKHRNVTFLIQPPFFQGIIFTILLKCYVFISHIYKNN